MALQNRNYIYGKFIFAIIILSILTGCYSDYVMLNNNLKSGGVWNSTQTEFVFVGEAYAYRKASGVSAFPDGGQSTVLYRRTNLYICKPQFNELSIVADLSNLPGSKYYSRYIYLRDSLVYYKYHAINIISGEIIKVDSSVFLSLKKKGLGNESISSSDLKKKIDKVPVSKWGLELQKIHPKPDKAYIKDLICWEKGGSRVTRKAIIEQIISKKSEHDILAILEKMKEYGRNFDGYKKSLYEGHFEESQKYINELLAKKRE